MPGFGFRARLILQISALLGVCVLAAVQTSFACTLVGGAPQATYQFVGTCSPAGGGNCTGSGVATLVVQNYTLGTALTICNLVSFTYSSNVIPSYTITPSSAGVTFGGTLPASLPGPPTAELFVGATGDPYFESNTNGTWQDEFGDLGTGGTWSIPSTVPTLSTAVLCALGLLLAGAGALLAMRARSNARA